MQDDCTFFVDGWQFDGEGPAVEWWGAKQSAEAPDGEFPYLPEYMSNPLKIGELGVPGNYQTGVLSFCIHVDLLFLLGVQIFCIGQTRVAGLTTTSSCSSYPSGSE